MTTDDSVHAVLTELARRKGRRATAVLDAVFAEHGFGWRGDDDRAAAIARQLRAAAGTGDLAADLTAVATSVLTRFGYPCDPAEVAAAVTRHLARP